MDQKNPYYLHQENQMKTFNQKSNPNHNNPYQQNKSNYTYEQEKPKHYPQLNLNPYQQINPSQYPPINQYPYQPQYPQQYQPPPLYPYPQHQQLYSPIIPRPYQQQNQYSSHSASSNQLTFDHCPFCNKITNSIVEQKPIFIAWVICFILFCFTVLLFWIPFCFQSCKQRRYKCVNCKRVKFVIKNSC